jgi:hypothetical protein
VKSHTLCFDLSSERELGHPKFLPNKNKVMRTKMKGERRDVTSPGQFVLRFRLVCIPQLNFRILIISFAFYGMIDYPVIISISNTLRMRKYFHSGIQICDF